MQSKTRYRIFPALLSGLAFIGILSCSDQPTNSENGLTQVQGTIYQIPGCGDHGLSKVAVRDSCFSYQFIQDLAVDFCVSANCCPDSLRFQFTHGTRNDTLFVTVADTAARLCLCTCQYLIHAEFPNLPRNHYIFYCKYGDAIAYNEVVKRWWP
jgi:hypothetical protein